MKYILKTNKLLINSLQKPNNAFIYTGSPNKGQKDKGKLIIMLDFPEETDNVKELGNLLIQKIHQLYYGSSIIDQETILENILEESNENLPLLTKVDNAWLKKFNAIIAIIYKQETYFSPVGNVSAWVANGNELINVFDYLENNDIEKPSVDRIFTNILSGNIETKQTLLFASNSIFDYVSKKSLEKIALDNDPSGINIKLKEILFKIENRSFCSVSIKLTPYEENQKTEEDSSIKIEATEESNTNKDLENSQNDAKIKKPEEENSEEKEIIQENVDTAEIKTKETYGYSSSKNSIDELLNIQQKTKDILTKGKSSLDDKIETPFKTIEKKDVLEKRKKINKKKLLKNIFSPFLYIAKLIKKILIHKKSENTISLHTNGIIEGKPRKKINKKRILLISGIIILLGFTANVLIMNYKKQASAKKQAYEKILGTIDDKKTEYDLLSIYKDEKLANEKLKEISDLINELPQKTDEQKKKYDEILNNFTDTLNKVWNINSIKEPKITTEFAFYPEKIIKFNDYIVGLGKESKDIEKYSIKDNKKELIGKESIYSNVNIFEKYNNFVYGLDTNNKVDAINLEDGTINKFDISYHPNYKKSIGAVSYNDKIYILDPESNQIYKHTIKTSSLDKGEAWIQDGTDIKNALSIAIDSNIYLGFNDGTIKMFYMGKQKAFELKTINPIIKSIDKIYTDKTITEIYLLDSQTKRIIIINKKGELIKQYYFPTLNTLNNFIVDGASKTIYLQSENKVVEVK